MPARVLNRRVSGQGLSTLNQSEFNLQGRSLRIGLRVPSLVFLLLLFVVSRVPFQVPVYIRWSPVNVSTPVIPRGLLSEPINRKVRNTGNDQDTKMHARHKDGEVYTQAEFSCLLPL